ncbi:hypothetical protein NW767_009183 [Fusarium falciforme]|nr:hypothetical protein NW767_009183 [Fusarium falciforme]
MPTDPNISAILLMHSSMSSWNRPLVIRVATYHASLTGVYLLNVNGSILAAWSLLGQITELDDDTARNDGSIDRYLWVGAVPFARKDAD